jgi:hypothetical protein
MTLRHDANNKVVVDVDADRFLALWRAHPESGTYDVACGDASTWPLDHKWHYAADGFAPGRVNPVPTALVWCDRAYKRVPAPIWPPYWGRGTIFKALDCWGVGFTDGVTRTIWLLAHQAVSFPVTISEQSAHLLQELAGTPHRAPTPISAFTANPHQCLAGWSRNLVHSCNLALTNERNRDG